MTDKFRFEDHIEGYEDFMSDIPEMTEAETLGLLLQTIKYEIDLLKTRIEHHLDRLKYYKEPIDEENLRFLISELRRIERDLL